MAGSHSGFQTSLVGVCTLLLAATLWAPIYPREQFLQYAPTALALPALWRAARRRWLSDSSFTCLTLMLVLHIVGARGIYSYVPYDEWTARIVGSGPNRWFGLSRNHYDRSAHFAFGLLITPPLCEAEYAPASAA